MVDALAGGLPGDLDRVVVACRRPAAFAAALAATWRAGAVAVLPVNLGEGRLADAADAPRCLVLRDADVPLPDAPDPALIRPLPLPSLPSDRVVAEVFTSGSTKDRRRAPKTAGQLLGEAAALADAFAGTSLVGPVLATVPPHHIYGLLFGLLAPFAAGQPAVDTTALHPEAVALALRRSGARTLVSTPAHLRSLALLDPGEIDPGVHVFSSGAPLPPRTAAMLHDRFGVEVTEVFGSTETGGIAHRTTRGGILPDRFTPLPGVEIAVRAGRLFLVASPFLPPSAPRPFPCDDGAEAAGAGFRHLGRLDDVVKVAGKRVSLRELERALLDVPGVEDGAVVAEPDPGGRGARIRALVVAPDADLSAVRAALARRFDPVCVPRPLRSVPCLPRTATGKLPRVTIERLLDLSACAVPLRLLERDDTASLLEARIPRDLPDFRGHFPGDPVLPGVSQILRIVLPAAAACYPVVGPPRRIARLKFKATIRPGDRVQVHLAPPSQGRIRFELARNGGSCTVGAVAFAAAPAGGEGAPCAPAADRA